MQPRTKRQREVFEYITSFIEEKGYEPSYQQIARHFRIASKSAIAKHIAALEKQGLVLRSRESGSFGLHLRQKNYGADGICKIHWLDVPSDENFEESWESNPLFIPLFLIGFFQPEKIFAFRVRDDSMIEECIREEDIALIEKRLFVRDGDCVVAVIEENQIVLRNFYRDGAYIELRPSNRNYEIIRLPADKFLVKGIFRALLCPVT